MKKRSIYNSYVSILKKAATQPLDVRWDFETASNHYFAGEKDRALTGL
jgi:hypothetical protein